MNLQENDIAIIKTAFEKMQSKKDLLALLNYAKPLVYEADTTEFELKQLTWYADPKLSGKRYIEFKVKKKSGEPRSIHAPVPGLKAILKVVAVILQCVFEPHKAAMGFTKGKSIVDNARLHVGSNYVYNLDLKDFFHSIDQARVWKCFQLKPFNLFGTFSLNQKAQQIWAEGKTKISKIISITTSKKGNEIGYNVFGDRFISTSVDLELAINSFVIGEKSKDDSIYIIKGSFNSQKEAVQYCLEYITKQAEKLSVGRQVIANMLASLCCAELQVERLNAEGKWETVKRNVLPQGAPTSPIITNIICQRLDFLLTGVAKRFGLKYSRYADDITFSSMHNVYQPESDFLQEIHRIITEQGFHIKESKTRLQKRGYRQEVTGLLVNEKANVQQRYIKQLRMWLYYWERYGYDRAYSFFLQQYGSDKGDLKKGKPDMINVIAGKLDYLKMVKGGENKLYLKLKKRVEMLTSKNNTVNTILEIWQNQGIEKAMEKYYFKKVKLYDDK